MQGLFDLDPNAIAIVAINDDRGIAGLNKTTLKERLNAGWTVEDAVNKPVRFRMRGYRPSNCGALMKENADVPTTD